jgi:hypothetical protein
VKHACLVTGACDLVERQYGRQIHERAGHGRNGNVAEDRGIAAADVLRPPRPNALDTSLGRGCHLRRRRRAPEQPKQMPRRPAAQQRTLPACKYSRDVRRLDPRRAVPDAVDAGVLGKERAFTHAPMYPGRRDTSAQQLRAGNNPVLNISKTPELPLHRPALSSHTEL